MKNKKVKINYNSRNFNSIKADLEEHARLYYPDTFNDFSDNSLGSFFLDTVAYVGDMMSFYLDYQVNESFLETALDYDNIRKKSRNLGYKNTGRPTVYATLTFFVQVPANSSGLGPDERLIPLLKAGTELTSTTGQSFVLTEDVNFADPMNDTVASQFNSTAGKPSFYAIRAFGVAKSTRQRRTTATVGSFQRFRKVRVGSSNILNIHSVTDSEGHRYYEVDDLANDVVYINTTNPNVASDGVPEIIKPMIVPRRFTVIQNSEGTFLQFGQGTDEEIVTTNVVDPSQIALKMSGRPFITDRAFDPAKLLDSKTLGVAPSNTELTIVYDQNTANQINIAAGNVKGISNVKIEFPSIGSLSYDTSVIVSRLEVTNENPIQGDNSIPTAEELRIMSYSAYAAQKRTVTRNDYEYYVYSMPSKFGSICRASIINDPSSSNRRLSFYVISKDSNNHFVTTNGVTKENIKVWLNKNKMLNDNIDIYDAKIVNVGFDYEMIVDPQYDKTTVMNKVNQKLKEQLKEKMFIGEPFYITKIYNIINKVEGVIDTIRVTPYLKTGDNYSTAPVTIESLKSHDGTFLKAPKNVVFEIKFMNTDIRGTAI
jgi:hypothetical protein